MKDLTNQKFGNLTALSEFLITKDRKFKYTNVLGKTSIYKGVVKKRYWKCICDCGKPSDVRYEHLINGNTKSCGCRHMRSGNASPFFKGYGELPANSYSSIRRNSQSGPNKKEFSVSIEYLWELFLKQDRKCAITKLPISFHGTVKENKRSSTSKLTASLDRINSSIGYIEGNVQWLHKDINIMKNDHSQKKFIELCKLVAENN